MTECEGEEFLFPNDLCFGPDGALYMTDSGILHPEWNSRRSEYRTVRPDGLVYRIDIQSKKATKLDGGILFTNGIAFGPDDYLYINETLTGNIYRYRWEGRAAFGERETFANVIEPKESDLFKGTDGMAFGKNGWLYVTVFGQGDVTVLEPEGALLDRLALEGNSPTNIAFGPPGQRLIYVTEQQLGRIEVLEVDTEGLPLYS